MKIGLVCYPTHGGSGVIATELGKQLSQKGHQIHFFSYQVPFRLDQFYPNIYFHEVEVPTYPLFKYAPYSFSLASKIADVSEENEIDIIHAHYAIPHSVCGNLARDMLHHRGNSAPRVVTTLHGTDITLVGNHPSFFPITRYGMEHSDALTCVSKSLAHDTQATFEINKDIETIYNFVDLNEYKPGNKDMEMKKMFAPNGEKLLIHISNFRPVKRVTDVVKIFAKVRESIPSKLLMIGDGVEKSKAEALAKTLQVEDHIFFLGKQDMVKNLLATADLVLLPSEKESFGLVALEAMACEVPVVASRVGGLPEVISDGHVGYLAPVGEIAQMADKAITILQDDAVIAKMGKNGRDMVNRYFNAENVVAQYEALYHNTLASL